MTLHQLHEADRIDREGIRPVVITLRWQDVIGIPLLLTGVITACMIFGGA